MACAGGVHHGPGPRRPPATTNRPLSPQRRRRHRWPAKHCHVSNGQTGQPTAPGWGAWRHTGVCRSRKVSTSVSSTPGKHPAASPRGDVSAPARWATPRPSSESPDPRGRRATGGIGAPRDGSFRGLSPAHPLHLGVRHPHAHREQSGRSAVDDRCAPVGAGGGIGVLLVGGGQVRPIEDRTRGPVPADPLTFDRAGGVAGKVHAIVLICLVDRAGLADPHEVNGDLQVPGGQVGEPMGGGLVRHRVGVAQILDGDVLGRLRLVQQGDCPTLGNQQRRREIVDLDPL